MSSADLFAGADTAVRFDDGKEAGALRTIGEVAKALGIRQHVLRYWEEHFPMLKPLKRSGGRRYYRAEDVQMVDTIDRLVHREGYTLKGALSVLKGGAKADPVAAPVFVPLEAEAQVPSNAFAYRARLIAIRTTLASALHEA